VITRLTLLAAVAALVAAPGASARDRCAVRGAKVVKERGAVRVLRARRPGGDVKWFGCLRGRRPVHLTTAFNPPEGLSDSTVRTVLIVGKAVALRQTGFDETGVEGTDFEKIAVADLRPGGRRYGKVVATGEDSFYDGFRKLVLRGDSAAAWALETAAGTEIDVLGARRTRARQVAAAEGIVARSLRIGPAAVTWTQDGKRHTAPVP
jgi:hypothetical protein